MSESLVKLYIGDKFFVEKMGCWGNPNPEITGIVASTSFSENIQWLYAPFNDVHAVYTERSVPRAPANSTIWLQECYSVLQQHFNGVYEYVLTNANKFNKIWTHDKFLLRNCSNAVLVIPGGSFIKKEDFKIYNKSKNISIVVSNQKYTAGHQLRHEVVTRYKSRLDVFGSGYNKFLPYKLEGLQNYRYNIAIENWYGDYWFTEKLIDCFTTGTVPIYWGCPSIAKFFNTDGMIIFNNLDELEEKLYLCTPEYYFSKAKAIEENFKIAQEITFAEKWIFKNKLYLNI